MKMAAFVPSPFRFSFRTLTSIGVKRTSKYLNYRFERLKRKCSTSSMNLLTLNKRGLVENIFPDQRIPDLQKMLQTPQTIYCGFDPTADSLHIGNLLSLMVLLHGQRAGHNPIVVLGGATVMIGDPSGKTKERPLLEADDVEKNIIALMENVQRVTDNHSKFIYKGSKPLTDFRYLNNADWYKNINMVSFLSSFGRYFRVGEMITKHSVKSRLNSKEGITCTEFMYQIFQAYDWYHLFQKYNCTIQVGGNDQTGNISAGFDLIDKITKKHVFGLLIPLLLAPGGEKLGKSSGNSLWLDPKKSSPFEFYQYFFNLPDTEVEKYLKIFTFLPLTEIESIMEKQNRSPEQRVAQKKLAEQMTLLVHGESGIDSALRCTEVLFGDAIPALTAMSYTELQQLFRSAPSTEIIYDPEITVYDLCQRIKCFTKTEDIERIIKSGGVYINQQRITEPNHVLRDGQHILPNHITLVRVGKKNFYVVRWHLR
ncbi:tyrosine--tRNA ligase, mitochondrial-like isoform X1 [Biomphalaria glabrata]|uniref:Tyrosine--tRNA ligase n=2 Tax=Biomphalaria glabrata TaxID=6526 RepID=A0A9U8EMJ0_BIOGL|nr:tyrosine--tRNA ligase, mitochondrial-like isoform X1 [Biomphalaria glabrata]KAI8766512.1 tyrosine--tRNA ligase; mitochondrial-like [Biomphalaria glabrata]